jgi:hypothetical protein
MHGGRLPRLDAQVASGADGKKTRMGGVVEASQSVGHGVPKDPIPHRRPSRLDLDGSPFGAQDRRFFGILDRRAFGTADRSLLGGADHRCPKENHPHREKRGEADHPPALPGAKPG